MSLSPLLIRNAIGKKLPGESDELRKYKLAISRVYQITQSEYVDHKQTVIEINRVIEKLWEND